MFLLPAPWRRLFDRGSFLCARPALEEGMRNALPPPETVPVHKRRVCCDGGHAAFGHQRIWLQIDASGFVDCPYCDRRFQLDAEHEQRLESATPLQKLLTVSTSST